MKVRHYILNIALSMLGLIRLIVCIFNTVLYISSGDGDGERDDERVLGILRENRKTPCYAKK